MKILYVGQNAEWTTSRHRADALRRLGHDVDVLDSDSLTGFPGVLKKAAFKCKYEPAIRIIAVWNQPHWDAKKYLDQYDVLWANQPKLLPPEFVKLWSAHKPSILYINDNPFEGAAPWAWTNLLSSIPYYGVVGVVRDRDLDFAKKLNHNCLIRVWMSYDEIYHQPPQEEFDFRKIRNEAVFVGSYMPERGPFMAELKRRGLPLSIYGPGWQKAKEWPELKQVWRKGWITGKEYIDTIRYAGVVIGMVSEQNRDGYTQRSLEVPYIGGLLCCKRTEDHLKLFDPRTMILDWSTLDECFQKADSVLKSPNDFASYRINAQLQVKKLLCSNEKVCNQLLKQVC